MKKLILSFFLAIFLLPCFTLASSKMALGVNESIILNAESDLPNPEYKWVLLKNENIVSVETGKQFSYLFESSGAYKLNLSVNSLTDQKIETSSVEILVGDSKQFSKGLNIEVKTLPETLNDTVLLSDKNMKVDFILSESKGEIKEYRIDADINYDSDFDEINDNDIDNIDSDSFKDGSIWSYVYKKEALPTQAKIVLFDELGEKTSKEINIKYFTADISLQKLRAELNTFPDIQADKRVHMFGEKQNISIFAGNSTGKIIEYRIDTDINTDSDGDGKTNNDIDNLNHPSFKTGETFNLELKRAHGDKIIQLTVVSSEGKGSLIQKKFVWDDEPLTQENEFRLFVDNTEPTVGDTVFFGLEGVGNNTDFEIKWDFDGDKKTDKEGNNKYVSHKYNTAGEYEVLVQIKNIEQKFLEYATHKITVKDKEYYATSAPISDFESEIKENKVSFKNISKADETLSNKSLEFEWSFGDGNNSKEENPVYVYKKTGNYVIRLKVTDTTGQNHTKQALISINEINKGFLLEKEGTEIEIDIKEKEPVVVIKEEEKEPTDAVNSSEEVIDNEKTQEVNDSSFFLNILKGLLILIVVIISFLIIYLLIQKIKNPHSTFGEIIDEEKEKMLSILEGRQYEPPHGEIVATEKEVHSAASEILESSERTEKSKGFAENKNQKNSQETINEDDKSQAPESKKADIIDYDEENTLEEEIVPQKDILSEISDDEEADNNTKNDDDIPDWLKEDGDNSADSSNDKNSKDVNLNATGDSGTEGGDSDDDDIPDWLK